MTTKINKCWFNLSAHTQKNWLLWYNTWEGFFPILPGALQSTDLAVQAIQGSYSFQLSALCIQKSHLYDLHVTSHNQTNTGIYLSVWLLQSLSSTASPLHFPRPCKAEGKTHTQARPVQGPAWLQRELNPISCTANRSQSCQQSWRQESGSTTKPFAVPKEQSSDSPVSPLNVLHTGIKSYRVGQCSYFIQIMIIYTKYRFHNLWLNLYASPLLQLKSKHSPNNTLLHI